MKRMVAGLLLILSALAGPLALPADGTVYQAGVSSIAPSWVRPLSDPVGVIGINLSQDGGELLTGVTVTFSDYGADGKFAPSDLLSLTSDAGSGVALYLDNKTSGTFGGFDVNDTFEKPSSNPSWNSSPPLYKLTLGFAGLSIPGNEMGNNTGPDFFVAIRTSATASDGDDFTCGVASDGISTDLGNVSFPDLVTGRISIDGIPPRAEAGPDVLTDEGAQCVFTGWASTDNVGLANYSWIFGDFSAEDTGTGNAATHVYEDPGRFIVILNVTDTAGNHDQDTLIVTVRNINDRPVITSVPPVSTLQGEPYIYLCQASDADSDQLTFSISDGPANMTVDPRLGLVEWTPGPWDVGGWPVNLQVTDMKSQPVKQSFILTVQNVNDPPIFTSNPVLLAMQNVPYEYQAEAVDPDYDRQIVFTQVAGPAGMNVSVYTGRVTWTPTWEQVGLSRIVLGASDGQYTVYQEFVVNVTNSNDPPVILSLPPVSAQQGVNYAYQVQAFDPDGDELRYYLNPAPTNMTVNSTGGLIAWTPGPDQVSTVFVRLEVMDGRGGRANQTFYISVANVNDPPEIRSNPPPYVRQGALYTYRYTTIDPDGDSLTYTLLSGPRGMTLNSTVGLLEWVPRQEAVGRTTVVVQVSDGHGGLAVQSFSIQVQDVNDPPFISAEVEPFAYQGQPYVTQVKAGDPDGDPLTYILLNQLPNMELDRRTGLLVWVPSASQKGEYHIVVRVTDANGSSAETMLNITVQVTNCPPTIGAVGVLKAQAGVKFVYRVKASDPDNGMLTYTSSSRLFRINSTTGEISFTPLKEDAGTHEFTVDVLDDCGFNATATGVLVIWAPSQGTSAAKIAGYGLAGLGGSSPWMILVLVLMIAAVLAFDYARTARKAKREETEESAGGTNSKEIAPAEEPKGDGNDDNRDRASPKKPRPGTQKCAGCRQAVSINSTADNYACSCGTMYHRECFRKLGKCSVCGRGKDGRKK